MLAWIAIVLRGFNSGGALRAIQYSCIVFHETCQTFVSTVSQPKISKFRRTSYTKNSPDIRFCSHCPLIQRIPILIRYGPPTNAFSQPNHAYMHYTSATRILVATIFFSTRSSLLSIVQKLIILSPSLTEGSSIISYRMRLFRCLLEAPTHHAAFFFPYRPWAFPSKKKTPASEPPA